MRDEKNKLNRREFAGALAGIVIAIGLGGCKCPCKAQVDEKTMDQRRIEMAEEKITVLAKIKARKGLEETVRQEGLALVKPTRKEPGCISYDFHQDSEDKSSFMFYENWVSKKALDEHIAKPHLQAFIGKAEELLAEPMDVTIWKKLS